MSSQVKLVFVIFVFFSIMLNVSASPSIATWYGAPNGDGTDGGACGYGSAAETINGKYVTAVGNAIFGGGHGCGSCYMVKCSSNSACSGKWITVVVIDQCPGCDPYQFDLSGTAFGGLALPGKADQLRNAGRIQIDYQRTVCHYIKKIQFVVDNGSNPNYIAVNVQQEGGAGDLSRVAIQQGSGPFLNARQVFGATWAVNAPVPGPLSIRLTTTTGKSVTAKNVIPVGWRPGKTYNSIVQF